jgi:uncharacterized protein (DUF58 family)
MAHATLPPNGSRRRTTLTREGLYWLLASAAFWLTGWLKGYNLILLLGYLLVLIWFLNWWVARRALRGVRPRRSVRPPIFAGTSVNWGVEVEVNGRQPLTGCEVLDEGPAHSVRWFLGNTAPGQAVRRRRELILPRRGLYECRPLRAVTSFPFGLVRRSAEFGTNERFVVLPPLGRVHLGRLRRWLMHSARPDERARRSRRRLALEAEFHGLRQFRPGDSPRWIHWRTTARTGELVVREFDHGTHHDLMLIIEPFAAGEASKTVDVAVSFAATVCWAWLREAGDRIVLAIAGPDPVVLSSGDHPAAALRLLEALAPVAGSPDASPKLLVRRLLERPLPFGPALLISSRPDDSLAKDLSGLLDRPVAYLNAAEPPSFYQPPV